MDKAEKESRKNDFEGWITFIPDEVIKLKKMLPKEVSEKLDFSEESLDVIEKYLLQNYSNENFIREENKILLDRLARYVGSAFRRSLPNAYWDIELDDKNDVFFTLPVIKVKGAQLAPFSPHILITTLLARKRGNFLSTILGNTQKMVEKQSQA
jgi:hypothetical protein